MEARFGSRSPSGCGMTRFKGSDSAFLPFPSINHIDNLTLVNMTAGNTLSRRLGVELSTIKTYKIISVKFVSAAQGQAASRFLAWMWCGHTEVYTHPLPTWLTRTPHEVMYLSFKLPGYVAVEW
jgi:hypothetical protein